MDIVARDLTRGVDNEKLEKGGNSRALENGKVVESKEQRTPILLQRCRICASEVRTASGKLLSATRVFGEEGRRRNLQRNIQKYLHITVSLEDKLPKIVCASCVGKLDGIHAFAAMALRSQERLRQELSRPTTDSAVTVESSDSSDGSSNKLADRGLLHSILTKGSIDTSNDGESIVSRQRTPSTEEMEVKVDPMLFLQCALEQPSSIEYSDYSDDSDCEINSYCSPNSEPLPLTKKLEIKSEARCATARASTKCRDSNDNEKQLGVSVKRSASCDEDADIDDYYEDEEDEDLEKLGELEPKLKPHVCKVCARPFASQLALQNHLWSHLPTSSSKESQRQQQSGAEANGAVAGNDGCSENNVLGITSFICPICGKKISTKGNLKVHLETHRPKGKYGCDICGRIFKTQSNLFRHKEYHSNVQFPCSVCGRVYPTNSTLRAHSITHSDLRPHACPLCDKTFKRNQDLKFHINQHTGARPYQCPYCPKAFASSGNCFSHRKRMHPKEVHRDRQRAADLMR